MLKQLRRFFSNEAGQSRREGIAALDTRANEALDYYLGPTGIPDRLRALNQMFNPVIHAQESGEDFQRAFDPERSLQERLTAGAEGVAGVGLAAFPAYAAYRRALSPAQGVLATLGMPSGDAATQRLYHASNNPNLTQDAIISLREGSRQGRRGRPTGGFYTSTDPEYARRYGEHLYDIEIPPGANILDGLSPEHLMRISPERLQQYLDAGYDAVRGTDIRGLPETVIINPAIISRMSRVAP
jgi:hypothetical protein